MFYYASVDANRHSREGEQRQFSFMMPQPDSYSMERFRERDVGRDLVLAGLLFLLLILEGVGLIL